MAKKRSFWLRKCLGQELWQQDYETYFFVGRTTTFWNSGIEEWGWCSNAPGNPMVGFGRSNCVVVPLTWEQFKDAVGPWRARLIVLEDMTRLRLVSRWLFRRQRRRQKRERMVDKLDWQGPVTQWRQPTEGDFETRRQRFLRGSGQDHAQEVSRGEHLQGDPGRVSGADLPLE